MKTIGGPGIEVNPVGVTMGKLKREEPGGKGEERF